MRDVLHLCCRICCVKSSPPFEANTSFNWDRRQLPREDGHVPERRGVTCTPRGSALQGLCRGGGAEQQKEYWPGVWCSGRAWAAVLASLFLALVTCLPKA